MSTYQDEKKYSSLARILKDEDYVIIDTCSLMEDSFPEFLDILEETKKEYLDVLPVYVLDSSIEELKKHAANKEQKDKKIAAKQAIRIIDRARRKKTIDIISVVSGGRDKDKKAKDEEYYFADVEIISKVTLDRTQYQILVITQDKKLASDLLNLNNSQAVHGSKVRVYKIEANAELSENKGEEKPTRKAGSSVLNKETSKSSHSKPQPEPKPAPAKPRATAANELSNKIVANDQRLHSNLFNKNYSKEKLVADIRAQLADLAKIGAEKTAQLRLSHNSENLTLELKRIEQPEPASLPAEKPAEQPAAPKKAKEGKIDLWYEYGQTIEEAFRNVGMHYGVIFRDPGVPYVRAAHGRLNFTTEDLTKIAATYGNTLKKEGVRIIKQYRSVYLMAERTPKGIKAWIDLDGVLAPVAETPKKDKPVEPTKANEAKEQPKPVAETKKKSQKKDAPAANISVSEEGNLVAPKETEVIVAESTKTKGKSKASKGKKPAEPQKNAEKPVQKPNENAVQKETESPKPAVQKSAKKKKPAAPEQTEVKAAPAPSKQPEAKPHRKTNLEEAIETDVKLKANLNNPNYPKEQKAKDIEEQIVRVKKIAVKDRDVLSYDLVNLKSLLVILR